MQSGQSDNPRVETTLISAIVLARNSIGFLKSARNEELCPSHTSMPRAVPDAPQLLTFCRAHAPFGNPVRHAACGRLFVHCVVTQRSVISRFRLKLPICQFRRSRVLLRFKFRTGCVLGFAGCARAPVKHPPANKVVRHHHQRWSQSTGAQPTSPRPNGGRPAE